VIASLTGKVLAVSSGVLVIEVSGVGFTVHTTARTSSSLHAGQDLAVFTSLVVREDAFTLYGFLEKAQLEVFELLRSVNGVGPKSALAILGELSVEQIAVAVTGESDGTFKAVSGIGAKTAKLITVSLAGKLNSTTTGTTGAHTEQTVAALMGLGWSERLARDAVTESVQPGISSEELLKTALRLLARTRKS
jgi:holliday junction DNA helicase RuvA